MVSPSCGRDQSVERLGYRCEQSRDGQGNGDAESGDGEAGPERVVSLAVELGSLSPNLKFVIRGCLNFNRQGK